MSIEGVLLGWIVIIVLAILCAIFKLQSGCARYAWFVLNVLLVSLMAGANPADPKHREIIDIGAMALLFYVYITTNMAIAKFLDYNIDD